MRKKGIYLFMIVTLLSVLLLSCKSMQNPTGTKGDQRYPEWRLVNELKISHSVFYAGFRSLEEGVTVGYHGATYVTHDGGVTWIKGDNEANCRYGLDYFGDEVLWTVGNYGGNRLSLNGGISLMPVTDLPLVDERPNCFVQMIDLETVWVGSPLTLAISKDAGYSWEAVDLPDDVVEIAGIHMVSSDKGYLVSETADLFSTSNGGLEWVKIGAFPTVQGIKNTDVPAVSLYFEDELKGKLVYLDKNQQNYAFETFDGGVTWNSIGLPKVERSAPFISEDGETLSLVDSYGRLKLFSWSE